MPVAECYWWYGVPQKSPAHMLFLRPDVWRTTNGSWSIRRGGNRYRYYEISPRPGMASAVALGINCTAAIAEPLAYAANYSAWLDGNSRYYDEPIPPNMSSGAIASPVMAWPGSMSVAVARHDTWWFTDLQRPLLLQGPRDILSYDNDGGSLETYEETTAWLVARIPVVTVDQREPDAAAARVPFLAVTWCTIAIATIAVLMNVADFIPEWINSRKQLLCLPFEASNSNATPLTYAKFLQLRQIYPSIHAKHAQPRKPVHVQRR